jgi:hypothetical protein
MHAHSPRALSPREPELSFMGYWSPNCFKTGFNKIGSKTKILEPVFLQYEIEPVIIKLVLIKKLITGC